VHEHDTAHREPVAALLLVAQQNPLVRLPGLDLRARQVLLAPRAPPAPIAARDRRNR
jgi:hypothetical protein